MSGESGGPYLQAAIFCERVLQEQDGVLSVIRIVDRLTVTASGPQPPDQMPPTLINLSTVITLKSGFARGSYALRLIPTTPSGKQLRETSVGVLFEGGEDRGVNVLLNIQLQAEEDGLYWFDVLLADQLLTRMPLRLVYQRLSLGTHPGTP